MISFCLLTFILFISKVSVALQEDSSSPDPLPSSCAEALLHEGWNQGIYKIEVKKLGTFQVYCIRDPKGGPAWTTIQRRIHGIVDFYRNFTEYESGFGDPRGEHFLGLKKIYELTNAEEHELWIKLKDFDREIGHANYGEFSIGTAGQGYFLKVSNYFGTAGDSLKTSNRYEFNTYGSDRNECAKNFRGAWWMDDCYRSHLNGQYRQYADRQNTGINWMSWRKYSLPYAHMAIRPIRFRN